MNRIQQRLARRGFEQQPVYAGQTSAARKTTKARRMM